MSLLSRQPRWCIWRKSGLVVIALVALALSVQVQAKESVAAPETVSMAALPREVQTSYQLVLAGGPFPFSKDGSVFGNRERILPLMTRGYYHEFTVSTPGASNRGARRLICGGQVMTVPDVCYYTGDHYASFKRIQP